MHNHLPRSIVNQFYYTSVDVKNAVAIGFCAFGEEDDWARSSNHKIASIFLQFLNTVKHVILMFA